jgi:hypothetical protein
MKKSFIAVSSSRVFGYSQKNITNKIHFKKIEIDGNLNEPIWQSAQ